MAPILRGVKLLLTVQLLLTVSVSYAFTPLVFDPSVGINYPRHGGTTGWVARWDLDSLPEGSIEYWINPSFPPDIQPFASQYQLIRTIQRAFQVWEDVPTSKVKFRFMGLTNDLEAFDGKNVITFFPQFPLPESHGGIFPACWYADRAGPITLPNGLVLQASFPAQVLDCDIVVNPRGRFSFTDEFPLPAGTHDFLGILVHEIGHLLGLDHSGIGQTTMYAFATFGGGLFQRELTEDDVIGISMLYPDADFLQRQGRIAGTVRGPSGQPIFGAHVVALEADTGRAISSTISGVIELRSDEALERFSTASGDYLLIVPPGEYLILAEPFGGPGQGQPYLAGVFGSAAAGALFVNTNFTPALATGRVRVGPGEKAEGIEIWVGPRSASTPVIGRTASFLWREDLRQWVHPARAKRGTTQILSFEKGVNLIEGTRLLPGVRARFLGNEITVTGVDAASDGRSILIWVAIASNASPGLYVLEISTPNGVTYFPGSLRVMP